LIPVRIARAVLAAVLSSSVLIACSAFDYDLEQSERSIQPVPAALTASMNKKGMAPSSPVLVRLYKQESELELWKMDRSGRYALLKTYPICRWSGKLGPKTVSGDRQAPEGFYSVSYAQMNPDSRYYLSFNLGFPNRLESALGYSGEALMIHGACSSSGCYAVTDAAAAEIYAVARDAFRGGQKAFQVQAFPFRMTAANFAVHRDNPNMPFWNVLKEGSDHFELTRQEPRVGYCGQRYVFNAANALDLNPLADCPELEIQPALAAAVAAKQQKDAGAVMARIAAEPSTPAMSYVDGGMHPSFRAILGRSGPKKLAKMTSERTEVSRPDAALADPYLPLFRAGM
jgi:murein L,D-transpeptidase YafK